MPNNLSLKVEVDIKASKAKVWRALTDPAQIKEYLFGTNTVSDWKVGSPITFSGEWEGKPYVDKGVILEIEKEKKLKYSYWSGFSGKADIPENYYTIEYKLSEKNGTTNFSLVQDKIETQEAKDHSEQNWKMVLDTMKKMIEGRGKG